MILRLCVKSCRPLRLPLCQLLVLSPLNTYSSLVNTRLTGLYDGPIGFNITMSDYILSSETL